MKNRNAHAAARPLENGYALVALLALMSILALALVSAAPSLHQQNMREREKEAIFRGEEVAAAIAIYHRIKSAPPKSMQELLDGVSVGTKKIQILRPSAAIDPLSSTGEWRYIKRGDKELTDFQQKVMLYTQLRQLPMREQWMQPYYTGITGLVDLREDEEAPCGENNSSNSSDGFIGVVSRNQCASVLAYYGIERRDKWVFTPLFR
jgi:type II secretory pathway pseudopilin PulG